jgi:replicative DNA helicase
MKVDALNSLPPQNIEAEESILGGILLDPNAMERVVDILIVDAFYVPSHKEIYQAVLTLHLQGKPTDLMSVTIWLQDHNLLDRLGGTVKLAQLLNRTVSAVNIDRFATLVMEKYIRRQLIGAGHEIVGLGFDTTAELEKVLDESQQKIFRLTQERPQQGLVPIADTLVQTFNNIESLHQKTTLPGIPCGFYDLDAMTSGFGRSDLIIIAGRPSMGKCLSADAEIVLADGSIKTIEQIYHQKQAELLTLKDDYQFTLTQPSAFVDDGIRPIFRVTTSLGRTIDTTIKHPYLTIQGWQKLSLLKAGDYIAVPRKINLFGYRILPKDKVESLARTISNADDKIDTVIIPNLVFQLQKHLVALFLNHFLAADDRVTLITNNRLQINCRINNERIARQVYHLFLRFGILVTLKKYIFKDKENSRETWQLCISERESMKNFVEEIGVLGRETQLVAFNIALSQRENYLSQDFIPKAIWQKISAVKGETTWQDIVSCLRFKFDRGEDAVGESVSPTLAVRVKISNQNLSRQGLLKISTTIDNLELQQLANSEIYWDEITQIEYIGDKQVYDLTIPDTHNFIANDICVHNTSFALNIAHNIAKEQHLPIAVFSLEMSKEQLSQRLLAAEAEIDSNRLRSGRLAQSDFEPLVRAMGNLANLPIYIDDTANLTVTQMRSQLRRLQSQYPDKLGLVLLDYLQLMEGSSDNRVQELSKITRSLKGLARELNVPIVALSQLSRSVEQRTNKRPMMSDLRESGSIEQDADLIIMLYRDSYYNPDSPDRNAAEIIVTKHRNGPTGTVKLLFEPEFTQFRNMQRRTDY